MDNPNESSGFRLPDNPFTLDPVGPDLFTGRADLLDCIERNSNDARQKERPRIIVLTGPRGIGKTSFLDLIRARKDADANEHAVNLAVCDPHFPQDKSVEWKKIHDIIDLRVVKGLGKYSEWYKVLYGLKKFFRVVELQISGNGLKLLETVEMEGPA